MAAILTTLLYVPVAGLLAAACFVVGVPPSSFASFGGAFHPVAGLALWWAIFYLPSAVYSGFLVPWGGRDA